MEDWVQDLSGILHWYILVFSHLSITDSVIVPYILESFNKSLMIRFI